MTSTLEENAAAGRRVTFTYYRDLDQADGPTYPGIITGTEPGLNGALLARIRLNGKRSTLTIPVDYDGITYLDEVGPVPDLPMGPFTPVADDTNGFYEKAGVLLAPIGEDGEDLVIITGDLNKARAAAAQYANDTDLDPDYLDLDDLRPEWAVFEWEPEDSEIPWTVRWGDEFKGSDQAVRIHYLPA
jgi:hypothetical protein